jgi:hypothetical protein
MSVSDRRGKRSARAGAVRAGALRAGTARAGALRAGTARAGALRAGTARAGALRAGTVRGGAVRPGGTERGCVAAARTAGAGWRDFLGASAATLGPSPEISSNEAPRTASTMPAASVETNSPSRVRNEDDIAHALDGNCAPRQWFLSQRRGSIGHSGSLRFRPSSAARSRSLGRKGPACRGLGRAVSAGARQAKGGPERTPSSHAVSPSRMPWNLGRDPLSYDRRSLRLDEKS